MIVSHDTSTVCGELLFDLTVETGSFWTAAAIDCQRAVSDVIITAECRHTSCNTNILRTNLGPSIKLVRHYAILSLVTSWLLFADRRGSAETSWRHIKLKHRSSTNCRITLP
jgi:hypothetical protein